MENINSQSYSEGTVGPRPLIRVIGAFLITPLLAMFIYNLFDDPDSIGFAYPILITLSGFFPSFYIASFLIARFFLRHHERGRYVKYVLYVLSIIGLDLIYKVVLLFVVGGWGPLWYGILEVVTLIIAALIFSVFTNFESKKQMVIIWTVFCALFLLNIFQYFGFLRPGLLMVE